MPSPLLEETDVEADPDVLGDGCPDDMNETTYAFLLVFAAVRRMHVNLHRRQQLGQRLAPVVTQRDVDEIVAANECAIEILHRDDWPQIREDFGHLDDETLADVHATLGNVAPHLGLELDVSDLVGTGGDD